MDICLDRAILTSWSRQNQRELYNLAIESLVTVWCKNANIFIILTCFNNESENDLVGTTVRLIIWAERKL